MTIIGVMKPQMDNSTYFHPNWTHLSKIGNSVHEDVTFLMMFTFRICNMAFILKIKAIASRRSCGIQIRGSNMNTYTPYMLVEFARLGWYVGECMVSIHNINSDIKLSTLTSTDIVLPIKYWYSILWWLSHCTTWGCCPSKVSTLEANGSLSL